MRIWWVAQVPVEEFHYPVDSLKEAFVMLDAFARYDLFQIENNIKPDFASAGGLHIWKGEEWEEWEDQNGDTISDYDIATMAILLSIEEGKSSV